MDTYRCKGSDGKKENNQITIPEKLSIQLQISVSPKSHLVSRIHLCLGEQIWSD